jgi:hypothetical protein
MQEFNFYCVSSTGILIRNCVETSADLKHCCLHCILIDTILIVGESLDKLIFMKKMNEAWSSHCQQIIMCRSVSRILA